MVAVAVGDDDVLDVRRIETEPAQAAFDQLGCFPAVVQGVDQDDPSGVLIAQALTQAAPT